MYALTQGTVLSRLIIRVHRIIIFLIHGCRILFVDQLRSVQELIHLWRVLKYEDKIREYLYDETFVFN